MEEVDTDISGIVQFRDYEKSLIRARDMEMPEEIERVFSDYKMNLTIQIPQWGCQYGFWGVKGDFQEEFRQDLIVWRPSCGPGADCNDRDDYRFCGIDSSGRE